MPTPNRPGIAKFFAALLGLFALAHVVAFLRVLDDRLLTEWMKTASAPVLLTTVFNLALALAAASASMALWQMNRSAFRLYSLWAVLLVVAHAVKDCALKLHGKTESTWWEVILGPLIVAVVLALIAVPLRNAMKHRMTTN